MVRVDFKQKNLVESLTAIGVLSVQIRFRFTASMQSKFIALVYTHFMAQDTNEINEIAYFTLKVPVGSILHIIMQLRRLLIILFEK